MSPEALPIAAEAINDRKPDLAICGGDLITGGFTATSDAVAPRWDLYSGMKKAIHAEHHAVVGNHDLVIADRDHVVHHNAVLQAAAKADHATVVARRDQFGLGRCVPHRSRTYSNLVHLCKGFLGSVFPM